MVVGFPHCSRDNKLLILRLPELLKNETSTVDITGPTLPALKSLLEVPKEFKDPSDGYAKLVHGILSACLVNIDHMRCVCGGNGGLSFSFPS